ncbi:MAG: hypothetical protein QG564_129 [Campylobacterota bacterium]|nr:hypothetical protein [Campylobacterota bacterium]
MERGKGIVYNIYNVQKVVEGQNVRTKQNKIFGFFKK